LPEAEPAKTPAEAYVVVRAERERAHRTDAVVRRFADEIERPDPHTALAPRVVREVRAPERDEDVAEERDERAQRESARDQTRREREMVEAFAGRIRDGAAERTLSEDDIRVREK